LRLFPLDFKTILTKLGLSSEFRMDGQVFDGEVSELAEGARLESV